MGKWTAVFWRMLTMVIFFYSVSMADAKQTELRPSFRQLISLPGPYGSNALLAFDDDQAPANRDNRFRDNYNRWRDLPLEEKKQLRDRMERLNSLPPAQKERFRERSQQWERLPAEDRDRIRQSVRRWNDLTPEERRDIRRQLDNR